VRIVLVALLALVLACGSTAGQQSTWQTIQGGRITDGLTIEDIQIHSDNGREELRFIFDGEPGHFNVEYTTHPAGLVITLSGVRRWAEDLQLPEPSAFIGEIRSLITLDDSAFRYYARLNVPVYPAVRTKGDTLVIDLDKMPYEQVNLDSMFSLRTKAYEGEEVDLAEEFVYRQWGRTARVIRAKDGWVVEAGLFPTLEAAERAYERAERGEFDPDLVIEERGFHQIPEPTASRFQPWRVDSGHLEEDSEYFQADVIIPVLKGLPEKQLQDQWNDTIRSHFCDTLERLQEDAADYYEQTQDSDWPMWPYVYSSSFHPAKNNEHWLSLVSLSYKYTGGAHGIGVRKAWNFHIPSGSQPLLGDLFEQDSSYREIIAAAVNQSIQDDPDRYFLNEFCTEQLRSDQPYYLTDTGLVLFFEAYEIAPYAAGLPEFFISYEELPPIRLGDNRP